MTDHEAVWRAHQRARWLRPDAHHCMRPDAERWIRPDVGRFLKPGTNPADVFPALDRKFRPDTPTLFGEPVWRVGKGTVAAGEIDGKLFFGINSTAPGYDDADWNRALATRDVLIEKYTATMNTENVGRSPNDALFHAEATVLLRGASDIGGSLANRSIQVYVDRRICDSCDKALPKLGLELAIPT